MLKTKIQQLKEAEAELEAVQQKIEDIKASILKEVCPYKVGNKVVYNGKKVEVTDVILQYTHSVFDVMVVGAIGMRSVIWSDIDDPILKEAADKINSLLN